MANIVQSRDLKSLPCDFAPFKNSDESIQTGHKVSIPVIDLSMLSSTDPEFLMKRAKVIEELGKACEEWGFFMVVNHGIPEDLVNSMFSVIKEFFDTPEEKLQLKSTEDSSNIVAFRSRTWWHMRALVHPEFHCPNKPNGLREIVLEYSRIARVLARKIIGGISLSLGLEEDYIEKAMELDSMSQHFGINYYPPSSCDSCHDDQQPSEPTIGIPAHTDSSLLIFLLQNGVDGLDIQKDGKWIRANAIPGSIFVNLGDHLEIISNGRYKRVWHRSVVNEQNARYSVNMGNGPSPDTVVAPASPLLRETPAAYAPMKYSEYVLKKRNYPASTEKPFIDLLKLH